MYDTRTVRTRGAAADRHRRSAGPLSRNLSAGCVRCGRRRCRHRSRHLAVAGRRCDRTQLRRSAQPRSAAGAAVAAAPGPAGDRPDHTGRRTAAARGAAACAWRHGRGRDGGPGHAARAGHAGFPQPRPRDSDGVDAARHPRGHRALLRPRGGPQRRAAAGHRPGIDRDRSQCGGSAAAGERTAGGTDRQRTARRRGDAARVGHPSAPRRRLHRRAVSHRRRTGAGAAAAARAASGSGGTDQGAGRDESGRTPQAAGRPRHVLTGRRPQGRSAHLGAAGGVRRKRGGAPARHRRKPVESRTARIDGAGPPAAGRRDGFQPRHVPDHRPHRLRKIDHAVRDAAGDAQTPDQHPHHRGSGGIPH